MFMLNERLTSRCSHFRDDNKVYDKKHAFS